MFRHVGQSENKVTVEIMLKELNISISVPNCEIIIVLERSDRKTQSQPVPLINKIAVFNTPLKLPATMYFDPKKKCFSEKKAKIIILVKYDKGIKQAGVIQLDFADYLNQRLTQKNEKLKLTECPDKEATLTFDIAFLQDNPRSKTPEITQIKENFQKEHIEKISKENIQLKQQLDADLKAENEQLRQQIQQFQPQVIDLQKERMNHLNRIKDLEAQLTVANNQTELYKLKLKQNKIDLPDDAKQTNPTSQLQMQNQQLVLQVKKLQEQLQLKSNEQPAHVKQLEQQNAQLQAQIKKLTEQPQKQEQDNGSADLKQKIQTLTAQCEDYAKNIKLLNESSSSLKERILELESQTNTLKQYKKEAIDAKNLLEQCKQELYESRQRIVELEDESEKERPKETQLKIQIEQLREDLEQLKSKHNKLYIEHELISKERTDYEKALDQLTSQYDNLEINLLKSKERYAKVMHEFLCYGDSNAIEILEKYSQE